MYELAYRIVLGGQTESQLALTFVGWPNGENLVYFRANLILFKVNASRFKSTQLNASPGQMESDIDAIWQRCNLATCVYLLLCLARALEMAVSTRFAVNSRLVDTPLLWTPAITDKIQLPAKATYIVL